MDAISTPERAGRRGFTLVEMLAVIVIIAILTGMITGAAVMARRRAKITAIATEIQQLDFALKAYKAKFGDYPPDFWGVDHADATIRDNAQAAVVRHVRRAFPRYVFTDWDLLRFLVQMDSGVNIFDLDPASALHFWLAGPDGEGFSANPRDPFTVGTGVSRIPPFFDFDPERVVDAAGNTHQYYPAGIATANSQPYVYFRARQREYGTVSGTEFTPFSYIFVDATTGDNYLCVPYHVSDTTDPTVLEDPATVRTWNNATSYQIISAGLDGKYNDPATAELFRHARSGAYFSEGDYDNQTNFASGTLEDEMP